MHEDAICQHRRGYTYTVPYVLANPICATRDHETGMAMSRLMATGRCRGRDAPRLCRASRPRHRQPCGFHRLAGHECGLRRTRIFTNGITRPIALQLPWDMMQSLREDPSCTLSTLIDLFLESAAHLVVDFIDRSANCVAFVWVYQSLVHEAAIIANSCPKFV